MTLTIDAIYEGGVFRPLDAISLSDNQPVRLQIELTMNGASKPSVRDILRDAGRLTELGPGLLARTETETDVTLEEVSDSLTKAGGKPLSEIVLDQRGARS